LYIPNLSSLHAAGSFTLISIIGDAHKRGTLCPPAEYIFKAFHLNPLQDTRVVILGQDPYHTPGKANGLAFGFHSDYTGRVDSSLKNIIKEVKDDTGETVEDLTLESWAKQGVLLLNTRLTTETGQALAHKGMGWEREIAHFLERLGDSLSPHVYILWGREAQSYKKYINDDYNLVLTGAHPSDLSARRGFFGGKYFSACNEFLQQQGKGTVKWGS
jgi:uracil-DNA glycosylase